MEFLGSSLSREKNTERLKRDFKKSVNGVHKIVFFYFSFPGRLDRKIELPNPDQEARARIMQIHSRKMNVRLDKHFK